MRLLHTSPLVFWTSCFILGLALGILNSFWGFVFIITCLASFSLLLIYKTFTFRFHLFFATLIILLGTLRMQTVFPMFSEVIPENQEVFVDAKIEEQLRSKDVWSTSLVHIRRFYFNKEWSTIDQKVVMISQNSMRMLRVGDRILLKTTLNKIENKGNPGEFDLVNYWLSKGVKYQCFAFIEQLKLLEVEEVGFCSKVLREVRDYSTKLIDSFVSNKQGDLLKAILLGDKSDLDYETKKSFANAGAMHLLAVSGMHVGIIAYLLNTLFQLLLSKVNRNRSVLLLIILLWFYAFVTGFSASVTRAVFMYSVLIGAQLFNRNYNPLNTLAFTALVLLSWNPLYLFDVGFQLSFLAMIGIFSIHPLLDRLFYFQTKWIQWLWKGTTVGLAAQTFTIPISLYYFHQFPNYFILSNIAVMLIAGLILGLGIVFLLLGKIPFVNVFLGGILFISLNTLLVFIATIDEFPGAVAFGFNPSVLWVICTYIIILLLIGFQSKMTWTKLVLAILPLVIVVQFQRYQGINKSEMCVFNCRYATVLLNSGSNQVCLYAGNERGLKDAKKMMIDYQKLYPGKVKYVPINGQSNTIQKGQLFFTIEPKRFHIDCQLNNKKIAIVTSSKFQEERELQAPYKLVLMPFLDWHNSSNYCLKFGAFRLPLN